MRPLAVLAILLALAVAGIVPQPVGEAAAALPPTVPTAAAAPFGVTPADLAGLEPPLPPAVAVAPRPAGTSVDARLEYGPFTIPAGHDFSRVHLDVPLRDGLVTRLSYRLLDAATGEAPTNMEVHIHHALWFRSHPDDRTLLEFGRFVFGTGEERTALDHEASADAVPGGPRYGLLFRADEHHQLLMMLHNKQYASRTVTVIVDVTFVHGTPAAILAASDCAGADGGDVTACRAGETYHPLDGRLWGAIFDVPRDADGPGTFVHPPTRSGSNGWTSPWSGTMVSAAGHVHPGGMETVVVNLGPAGSDCGRDLDADGFPGVTITRSRKIDRDAAAWPWSEDFQMGVTPSAWRAPVREGDRIAQLGVYANGDHASYAAMAFAGVHVDAAAPPPPRPPGPCRLADLAPVLVGDATGDPTRTVPNREFDGTPLPLCGLGLGRGCDRPDAATGPGLAADTIVIGGFAYAPGDRALSGPAAAPPRLPEGTPPRFVNADAGALVRHSVTSCPWPCNGPYAANYPLPDGRFDSGLFPNVDTVNGEPFNPSAEWWGPADLEPGLYSYYCRIHPTMRGAFEVVA